MKLDEQSVVSRIDGASIKELRVWVRAGWVRPAQGENGHVFDDVDIARVRLLCELRKDMKLAKDTIAIILPLLDQLHQTRRELRALTEVLGQEPAAVRNRVIARVWKKIGPEEEDDMLHQE